MIGTVTTAVITLNAAFHALKIALNPVTAAAAAVGAGLSNVAAIHATEPPKAESGGLLVGRSHNEGGILIEAEGDEYITAKDRARALGKGLFDLLNFAPLEKVKHAFAGMTDPSVPISQSVGSYYASDGSVTGRGSMDNIMNTIFSVVREELSILRRSSPITSPVSRQMTIRCLMTR